jgi:hypothetical protein
VVNWNEPVADGKAEPEHPAPVLALTAATDTAADRPARASDTEDGVARGLGIAALVVALGAAGLGALALRRRTGTAA